MVHLARPLVDELGVHVVEAVVVVEAVAGGRGNQHRHQALDVANAIAARLHRIVAQRLRDDARIDRIAVADPPEIRIRILQPRERVEDRALGVR